MTNDKPVITVPILKASAGILRSDSDYVVAEQPLEVIIKHGSPAARRSFPLAVTMRTPGQELELGLGFLFTENVIQNRSDVVGHRQLSTDRIVIELHPKVFFNEVDMHRNFYTSSSCGVCGKASVERVKMFVPYLLKKDTPHFSHPQIFQWISQIQQRQSIFEKTGGIHAAALFQHATLWSLCEDVGRHNAMDKLIGMALQKLQFPLDDQAVMVSGRASFELVQKALMAGIPILAAVGAPSSLAIELAEAHNMTLIGFLREGHFNVYCGEERIK